MRWRIERFPHANGTTVTATCHASDFYGTKADVLASFAELPDKAHFYDDADNPEWVMAEWTEPHSDADRQRLENDARDRELRAEFEAWKAAQIGGES